MVQILPVNETIASHNWLDSYPYKSISVMALHPIYMNIDKLGPLPSEDERKEFEEVRKRLNDNTYADYPEVLQYKSRYFKRIFDQQKALLFEQADFKRFFEKNSYWLVPYAAFVYLRDKMKSPNFREWGEFSVYNEEVIKKMSTPGSPEWDDIAVHYFIQYHLDKQLKEVTAYAREKGIVLKGDIPIGISPNSVEAWTEPHLFHLNAQAGAPPDDFAMKGQNWGFPTYNWERMSAEGFKWWKNRLQKMSDYFDAYRIDHILGFFRIWEIPIDAVEGVLGYFNPALPLSSEEIGRFGINFDYDRMVKPYIRYHFLHNIFGEYTDEVIEKYLEGTTWGAFKMKEAFDTQQKVNQHFLVGIEEEELSDKDRWIRNGLFDLIANVLFIQTGHDQWHPRISIHMTSSYAELDEETRSKMDQLYIHYFYKRHDDFWYHKGMEKLPAIIAASNMLVCGEDLGMVPDCVPPVMDQLNILSLEIQRMSKNPKVRFAHPADAPYLSVCTTSTHDMPTIRGWWEQDRGATQLFYNNELGNPGDAPFFAEPWVCQQIITQHMHSPAMWTTFPIQDLLAVDGELRWYETQEEQINQPSNVRHKWRYRMRQSIEDLKNAQEFNRKLKILVNESGRNSGY
jgi:4-alpha-glucanotransferase